MPTRIRRSARLSALPAGAAADAVPLPPVDPVPEASDGGGTSDGDEEGAAGPSPPSPPPSRAARLASARRAAWDVRYAALLAHRAAHGTSNVPRSHGDGRLGRWVHSQRALARSGRLDPGRARLLREAGFQFATPTAVSDATPGRHLGKGKKGKKGKGEGNSKKRLEDRQWEDSYDLLLEYIEERRKRFFESVGKAAEIAERARRASSYGRNSDSDGGDGNNASAGRPKPANAGWKWDGVVPYGHVTPSGYRLGRWVDRQRQAKRKGTLDGRREERLDEAGLRWAMFKVTPFEVHRGALEGYVDLVGIPHANAAPGGDGGDDDAPAQRRWEGRLPQPLVHKGLKLGQWLMHMLHDEDRGKLSDESKGKLDALGVRWRDEGAPARGRVEWEANFGRLREYLASARPEGDAGSTWVWDGDVPPSYQHPSGTDLSGWVREQRSRRRRPGRGGLDEGQVARLDSAGFRWTTLGERSAEQAEEAAWKVRYGALEGWVRARRGEAGADAAGKAKSGEGGDNSAGRPKSADDDEDAGCEERQSDHFPPPPDPYRGGVPDDLRLSTPSGPAVLLGRWVRRQHEDLASGTLPASRADAMDALLVRPWTMSRSDDRWRAGERAEGYRARGESAWMGRYRSLEAWVRRTHRPPAPGADLPKAQGGVPADLTVFDESGGTVRLGEWVGRQSADRDAGALSEARATMMDSLLERPWTRPAAAGGAVRAAGTAGRRRAVPAVVPGTARVVRAVPAVVPGGMARVVVPPAVVRTVPAVVPGGMARAVASRATNSSAAVIRPRSSASRPGVVAPEVPPPTATGLTPAVPAQPTATGLTLAVPTRPDEFSSWLAKRKAGWREQREARRTKGGVYLSTSPFPAWLADRKASWRRRRGRDPPPGREDGPPDDDEDRARAERARRFSSNRRGWDVMFPALCEYAERERGDSEDGTTWSGHVPSLYRFERPGMPTLNLGNWVNNKRSQYRRGELNQSRIDELEGIGLRWSWPRTRGTSAARSPGAGRRSSDGTHRTWSDSLSLLEEYKASNGGPDWDGQIRQDYRTADGVRLGQWAHAQRSLGKRGRLSEDKLGRLDRLGFAREASGSLGAGQQSWSDSLALLEEYRASNGGPDWDGHIPQKHRTGGGYDLGRWAHSQRALRRRGRLSDDRVGRLDRLGFAWGVGRDRGGYLVLLGEYAAARGGKGKWDGQITCTHRTDGGAELRRWAHSMRAARRKGKNISRERIEALDRLGFAWEDPSYKRGKAGKEKQQGKPQDADGGGKEKNGKKSASGGKTKRKRRKGDDPAPSSGKRRRKSAGSGKGTARPSGPEGAAGPVPAGRGGGQDAPSPAAVGPPANPPGPAGGRGAEPGPADGRDAPAVRDPSEPEVDEMMEEVYAALTAAV